MMNAVKGVRRKKWIYWKHRKLTVYEDHLLKYYANNKDEEVKKLGSLKWKGNLFCHPKLTVCWLNLKLILAPLQSKK
jgi:hypothetical protein